MKFGWQQAEGSIDREEYNDNWMRIFGNIPEFTPKELTMMKQWVNDDQFTKVALYLTNNKFKHKLDSDTAEFVIREIIRGRL